MSKASNQLPLMKKCKLALPTWYLYKMELHASHKLMLSGKIIPLVKGKNTHLLSYILHPITPLAPLQKSHHRITNLEVLICPLLIDGPTVFTFMEKMPLVMEDGPTSPSWENITI
jgi:hypothetical protein